MSNFRNPNLEGWHRNTELCCDVKTFLRSDCITKIGKNYSGVLTHDAEGHFSFVEVLPATAGRRNPKLYEGEHITLTRWNDGSIRLYFKKLKIDADFTVDSYAFEVANELRQALIGLL